MSDQTPTARPDVTISWELANRSGAVPDRCPAAQAARAAYAETAEASAALSLCHGAVVPVDDWRDRYDRYERKLNRFTEVMFAQTPALADIADAATAYVQARHSGRSVDIGDAFATLERLVDHSREAPR